MKKIITFLLLCLIMFEAKALEYGVWTDKLEDDITISYSETTMYKWYQEKINGEYLLYDIEIEKYPYNDLNNYVLGQFSNWQDECITNDYRLIENKDIYYYKQVKKIQYIKLENISKNHQVDNINIYENNKKINYEIIKASEGYNGNYFKTSSYIIIKLDDFYNYNDISVEILSKENYRFYKMYLYHKQDETYLAENKQVITNVKTTKEDNIINEKYENIYTDVLTSEDIDILDENIILIDKKTLCRYQDKLTFHYNIEKIYYDDNYHEYIDGYIKDEKTAKKFYKYENLLGKNNIIQIDTNNDIIKNNNIIKLNKNKKETINENKKENKTNKNTLNIIILISISFLIIVTITIIKIKKCRKN